MTNNGEAGESSEVAVPQSDGPAASAETGALNGALQLLAVVRAAGAQPEANSFAGDGSTPVSLIVVGTLGALVRGGAYRIPRLTRAAVLEHHQLVDAAMRKQSLVPAPYGIIFRDAAAVEAFLGESLTPLDEALRTVDGRWEFRLHIRPFETDLEPSAISSLASHIYGELRRVARAAMPFREADRSASGAAFLINRADTKRFVDRVHEMSAAYAYLALDLTGPWPPYDFVRIHP